MTHSFTEEILKVLKNHFGGNAQEIYRASLLIQYLNQKTVSAHKGSKARGSFGNLYAIYVLVEDYINNGFHEKGDYATYEGAKFSDLFKRQRELPFGAKLQNHALNQRMNQEFKKFFPTCDFVPIIRVPETKRYWFNLNLLKLKVGNQNVDISESVIEIINVYVASKRSAFESFISSCETLKSAPYLDSDQINDFILNLLNPNVDARIFEIVSYAILKGEYQGQTVFWGFSMEEMNKENLKLYKTGRTNANDGGIDFVMKPLGRFFQVTETTDVKKYFLDIDKLEKYPITFVVKSNEPPEDLLSRIEDGAKQQYSVDAVVQKYMSCIEEIINTPKLKEYLQNTLENETIREVLDEIIIQSKVEFNYED